MDDNINKADGKEKKSRRKITHPIVICCAIVLGIIVLYSFFNGWRLTPTQAAKFTAVPGNAELIEEIDLDWGKFLLFQTADQFFTSGCERKLGLWRNPVNCISDKRVNDGVITMGAIGWKQSEDNQVTLFVVQNTDPQVAYIDAGPGRERIRQDADLNTPVVFLWTHTGISDQKLAAHALDADGRVIYEYRYAERNITSVV